jgi:hypothetical protein
VICAKTNTSRTRFAGLETGLSRDYLSRLARQGRVPAKRLSVGWVFDHAALRAFLADSDGSYLYLSS